MTMTICHTLPVASSFKYRLKQARTRLGWKQTDLAEHAGVSHGTIKAWEMREEAPLGSPYLDRVAHTLGIDTADLVGDDVPGSRPPAMPPSSSAAARLTDDEWDSIQRLLPRIPEVLLVNELSRRVTVRAARESHDQSNVEPIGVRGIDFGDDEEEVETETGPA